MDSLSCTFMHVRRRPGSKAPGILAAHMAPAGTLVTWHNTWTPAPSCTRDTLMTRLEAPSCPNSQSKRAIARNHGARSIDLLPSMAQSCSRWNVGVMLMRLHFHSESALNLDWDGLLPETIQFSVYHFRHQTT